MKVLWLPHVPPSSPGWQGARQQHLARHLDKVCELHWIDWRRGRIPRSIPGAVRVPEVGYVHGCVIPPTLNRIAGKEYPPDWALAGTQACFRRAVARVVKEVQPDVIVWSSAHHMVGYPPFDLGVPAVFDHIDALPDYVMETFASHSQEIVVVSSKLIESVALARVPTHVIPNGVELDRYQGLDKVAAKKELGLEGTTVVSLIGLTCSPDFYFVDAVAALQDRANLSLLIVGGGERLEAIKTKAESLGIKRLAAIGPVPSSEVARYFAASDIGLYPGEDIEYYRNASPLKIVEYAAAGCQVVSSPVEMFREGWPCVRLVAGNADAFAAAILDSLAMPGLAPDLSGLGWAALSRQFHEVLQSTVSARVNVS